MEIPLPGGMSLKVTAERSFVEVPASVLVFIILFAIVMYLAFGDWDDRDKRE